MPEPDELPSWAAASGGEELPSWADGAEVLDEPEGLPEIPEGYREQGRRELTLPETSITGDASGRGRGSISMRPASEAVETREIEKDPAFARHRARTVGQQVGPDRRGATQRYSVLGLVPGFTGEEPFSYSGHRLPTLDNIRRFAQSGRFNDLAPPAPGLSPAAVEASEYGPLIAAADAAPGLFGPLSELVHGEGWGDYARREADTVREQQPADAAIGSVIGSVPYMLIPGAQETALARVGSAGLTGFGLGGMRAADASQAQDFASLARDTLAGGATEGATAATIGAGAESVSPMLSRLSQWARTRAAQTGETLTEPAARLRNAAAGARYAAETNDIDDPVRFAETLRRSGISRGLRSTRAAGQRGAEVRREANAVITDLARQADDAAAAARSSGSYREGGPVPGTVSLDAVEGALSRLRDSIGGQGAPSAGARGQIDAMIERYRQAHPDGVVPLDDLMSDWRAFGNPANFRDGQPWNVLAESRRGLRRGFRGLMEDAMESASGPEARAQLADALERVHAGRVVERGARRVADRQAGNRLLSLTDYLAAGSGATAGMLSHDPMTGVGTAAGAALLNRAVRGREHAVGAVALESLAARLRALGSEASRYAATLEAAQRRGPAALGIAHNALARMDPAYRAAVERAQAQEPAADSARQLEPFTFTAPETSQ